MPLKAEDDRASYTISGYVSNDSTGKKLIGVNVSVSELGKGTITNEDGFYSISLAEGYYQLVFSYIGYLKQEIEVHVIKNMAINVEMKESSASLPEVEVFSEDVNKNITNLQTGINELEIQSIRRIPALMGEVDVIKAIQLLPGVQTTSEGSSGFSVRGGSIDQNLILMDEATVYNASHFIGFFSIFNNDAVKDVKLYKGDIPARYGGRLSSVLDVRMKEGSMQEFNASGGIGTVASRLTLEGPIYRNKSSFILSGRRTYADIFLPFTKNEEIKDNRLYFYDLNAKISYSVNENNRIYLSGYFGRDVFRNQFAGMLFGNRIITLRWNHVFSKKLISNFSYSNTLYSYELGTPEGEAFSFNWNSDISGQQARADFSYYSSSSDSYKFGFQSILHEFNPGIAKGTGDKTAFSEFKVPGNTALEHAVYGMGENQLNSRLGIKYGLRISLFQNMGKATVFHFDEDFKTKDSVLYDKGEIYNSYLRFEPRFGLNYIVNDRTSLKGSYARTNQFIQLAQNSVSGTPLDVWFPASPNIKPQKSDHFSIGLFRNFRNHTITTSAEVYYKKMTNSIDFRDHAVLLLNPKLEGEVRTGEAWSSGFEFMLELNENVLNGWISYTFSKTRRTIEGINNGKAYDAPYDKPHDLSVVLNYKLNETFLLGANWIFSSGLPYTFPVGRYEIMYTILPIYSQRNAYRFDNYHRLDFSIIYRPRKNKDKKWQSEWNLSVYNVYNRKNTWAINFIQNTHIRTETYAEKTYLFSVVPALTYNFSF